MKRRSFTLEFKAEVVRHKKAENLSWTECGRKFDVLPKLIQQWERPYEVGELTAAAGRRAVSPEQAEITRLRAELSRSRMEVSILKNVEDPIEQSGPTYGVVAESRRLNPVLFAF